VRQQIIAVRHLVWSTALLLGSLSGVAHGAPISSYTVIDLGSGSPSYGAASSGAGILVAPGGQTGYSFPRSASGVPISTPANFPLLDPVPTGPFPAISHTAYSAATNVTLYSNGIATAIDKVGVNTQPDNYSWARSEAYYVVRNADGSWGQPVALAQGPTYTGASLVNLFGTNVTGVSANGEILTLVRNVTGTAVSFQSFVFDTLTKTSIDLSTLPVIAAGNFSDIRAVAIDDLGRIVALAMHHGPSGTTDDLILLTPAGINSNPLNLPEPSTLAVIILGSAGLAIHRLRARGRRD
jgi:hypothetical protein